MVLDKIYDYIVVGTGPGGATIARELTSQKKHTLIVEYGPRLSSTYPITHSSKRVRS